MYTLLAVLYIYLENPDYTHATTLEGITDRTKQVCIFNPSTYHLYIYMYIYIVCI